MPKNKTSKTEALMSKYGYIMCQVKCPKGDKDLWWAKFKKVCKDHECHMSEQIGMLIDDWMKS
jgi:hypothetical protein